MPVNLRDFFRACNPAKTLNCKYEQDRKYYIDFSQVRGAEIAEELVKTITWTDGPTCQLFSGHIGCGKSTELLRLKASLEDEGLHVVYFESSQMLEMGDIDVSDILLAIAHQVSASLKEDGISLSGGYFQNLLQECATFLNTPIDPTGASGKRIGKVVKASGLSNRRIFKILNRSFGKTFTFFNVDDAVIVIIEIVGVVNCVTIGVGHEDSRVSGKNVLRERILEFGFWILDANFLSGDI